MINNYALIKNGKVKNIILADAEFLPHIQSEWDYIVNVEELSPRPSIGWDYDQPSNTFEDNSVQPSEEEITKLKIKKSIEKGQDIIKDIAYLNIVNNKSEAQISAMMGNAANMKIFSLLSAGALLTAKTEIQNLDQTYFTVEEKNAIISSIDLFLATL